MWSNTGHEQWNKPTDQYAKIFFTLHPENKEHCDATRWKNDTELLIRLMQVYYNMFYCVYKYWSSVRDLIYKILHVWFLWRFYRNILKRAFLFRVSCCDRPLSVVRRRASSVVRRASCVVRKLFYLNIFSSETTHWILTKLHRNDPWVVPYQSCSNGFDWLHK